jgi:hypothetical protein
MALQKQKERRNNECHQAELPGSANLDLLGG